MPFTVTHILAVLPIRALHKSLSFMALAIGAMIPDFTLFFPLSTYHLSHSAKGLILYCLPAGLCVYLLYAHYGKRLLIDAAPLAVHSRVFKYRGAALPYTPANLLMISACILFGAATHIVWDAFSHGYGWGLNLLPVLKEKVLIFGLNMTWYKVVQYGSTIIGLPILVLYGLHKLKRLTPMNIDCNYRIPPKIVALICVSFALIPLGVASYHLWTGVDGYALVGAIIINSMGAGITWFFILSFLHGLLKAKA